MKPPEQILSEISGWPIENFTHPPFMKGLSISPYTAVEAMKQYATQPNNHTEIAKKLVEGIFGKEAAQDKDIVQFYANVNKEALDGLTDVSDKGIDTLAKVSFPDDEKIQLYLRILR